MTKFCTNCGREIPDGTVFCTGCGAKAHDAAEMTEGAVNKAPQNTVTETPEQPAYTPSAAPLSSPVPPETAQTVSTGYYFGMMFVFALPVIGWLICLISAFAGKNQSKKNFARAILIWSVIAFVISAIIGVLFSLAGGMFRNYIEMY